ncbi:unnamed protein product, partial [Prorocentrum cordatum]
AGPEQPYSEEKVEAALALLKPGKRTVRMCNVAVRAKASSRVESVVLYAAQLLAGTPGAEAALKKLQVNWGRRLLGCPRGPPIKHAVVVAQCWWPMRLGTWFLERVIMARARLQALPCDHPAAVDRRAAKDMGTPTWETAALRLLGRLPSPPANLLCHAMFPPERIEAARRDRAARKEVLREYRL